MRRLSSSGGDNTPESPHYLRLVEPQEAPIGDGPLHYVADMVGQLELMARQAGHLRLAELLRQAREEAAREPQA
jgi:hypothetical protein